MGACPKVWSVAWCMDVGLGPARCHRSNRTHLPSVPGVPVIGVTLAYRRRPQTEINVAQARFREIMSWEDWKAKARSLQPRCSECGSAAKADDREVLALTGRCRACAEKSDPVASNRHELCDCS
jgi:hypothetical protein